MWCKRLIPEKKFEKEKKKKSKIFEETILRPF
jgi:hypothetical protein